MKNKEIKNSSASSEADSTSIDNPEASATFAEKADAAAKRVMNEHPPQEEPSSSRAQIPKQTGFGFKQFKIGSLPKKRGGSMPGIVFGLQKKPAPSLAIPKSGKVPSPLLRAAQEIEKSTARKVRSGKPGLDQFIARMSPACRNMMDALAGHTGAPYQLSLPGFLHLYSLALAPRVRVKQGVYWSTPVLQMLVGALPQVGKSVVNTFIIGLLHEAIDSGDFPDVHEMDFSKVGLLEAIEADPWNAMSISDADASDVIKILIGSGKASFSQNVLAKGFCGERYKRTTSGKSIVIPRLYLGTALFVQPERVDDFLCNRSIREKGIVNRTLLFQALKAVEKFDTGMSLEEAQDPIKNLLVRVAAIRRAERSAGYIDLTLTSEAEKWLEDNQAPSSILRWSELTVRLATILHVDRLAGRNPDGDLEPLIRGSQVCLEDIQAAAGLVDLCESYTRNVETFCEDSRERATEKKAVQLEDFLRERNGSARLDVLISGLHMARKTIRTLISMFPDRFEEGEPVASGKKGQPAVVIRLIKKQ